MLRLSKVTKCTMAAFCLSAITGTGVFATADPMASRYGNTVVLKGPDGREISRMYYDADGGVTATRPDGQSRKGKWKLKGDQVCLEQIDPPPPMPDMAIQCNPFPGVKNVGETWETTTANGKVTATIIKGRP